MRCPLVLVVLALGCSQPSPDAADAGQTATAFTWTERAACPLARFEAMGAVVNGRLYVMGGFTSAQLADTDAVHVYDPATDRWSASAPLTASHHHSGVALHDAKIWLAGGLSPGPGSQVSLYDPADGGSTPGAALPAPRAGLALVFVDGVAHALGGLNADNATDAPSHWEGPSWTAAADLPNPRNHLGAAVIGKKIYVVGGRYGWDETAGNQATLSIYDTESKTWSAGAELPLARSEIAASTFEAKGKLFVIGGAVNPAKPSSDVLVYDPATNAWSTLTPLPGPRKGAVAAVIGDKLYVTTGSPTGVDPAATTWEGCCL